jgi:LPS O-antigen subunit length determinant protein (WzzB/FepE family)
MLGKYLKGRQDLGLSKGILSLLLEPKNPFEPEKRRGPRKDFVLLAVLVGLPVGAFVYFNFWL